MLDFDLNSDDWIYTQDDTLVDVWDFLKKKGWF